MARIRSIKPEFWADEKLSLLDPLTRLVFLGLISMADDAGRLVDSVKLLDGMLFPNTDDTCRDPLDTLARTGRVIRYRSKSGQSLLQLTHWALHQRVDNPSKYNLPGPDEAALVQPLVPSSVRSVPSEPVGGPIESLATVSRESSVPILDHRSSIIDHRPASNERAGRYAVRVTVAANQGITERWGEQPSPIRADAPTTSRACESVEAHGVPVEEACRIVYTLAVESKADRPPRTLGYWTTAMCERWDAMQAHAAAASTPTPTLVPAAVRGFTRAGDVDVLAGIDAWKRQQAAKERA